MGFGSQSSMRLKTTTDLGVTHRSDFRSYDSNPATMSPLVIKVSLIQNLLGAVLLFFEPFGPCSVLGLLRDTNKGLWPPLRLYNQ
jgi:hypothetical protein